MPVRRVKGGYQWGTTGKVYPTRTQAEQQGRAISMARKPMKKRKGGKKY